MNITKSSPLFWLLTLLLAASLACGSGSAGAPAITPIQQAQPKPPIQKPEPSPVPQPPPTQSDSSGGWKTFTDENNLYQIRVPADWTYSHSTGDFYYIDHFKSPDEQALVENVVYDDGTTFDGGQKGRFALDLIYKFYSNTGTSVDIRITSDQLMDDGSERLVWESKSGGYSGASYFETRAGRTTFLMFTIEWMNSAKDLYLDTLDTIVESYSIP